MKRFLPILVACVLLPITACSLKQKPTGEDYYAQGQFDFAEKEYKAAIENYQLLIDRYPFSPYAEDAELKIGLAYYQQKDYAEAVGALDDFQRMHPTSKDLELATYYIGMSYYDQMGREDQDQTKTQQALKRFQELEQRFPEGSFAQLAHEHVVVCREMLARNSLVVGNYYYKRANFRAAESRFAELMQRYPESPVAPDALFELGISLEKEGKKFSAAQAFAAVIKHFPDSGYAKKAKAEMAKLHQPVDTEEDPLPLVLAETGYGGEASDGNADKIVVRQRSDSRAGGSAGGYGADGLPVLDSVPTQKHHLPEAKIASLPPRIPSMDPAEQPPAGPVGSIAGAARAQAAAMTGAAGAAPQPAPSSAPLSHQMLPAGAADAPPLSLTQPPSSSMVNNGSHQMLPAGTTDAPPLSLSQPPATGPATLKQVRLSSNDPPLSVIFELSGPVQFEKNLDSNSSGATATVLLKDVTPDAALQTHQVFDKSIFKYCDISSSSSGTTVTLTTQPVTHFAVVPLDQPPRLLVTFTPQPAGQKTSSAK
jgi:outer membrane protein assembly factor BamD